ncbi:MAG TPA: hypothetical protein VGU25_06750 [Acidobacteriaceae bacterium]|nr:hypothetical protein [Acidobacteriaceae bacterium]
MIDIHTPDQRTHTWTDFFIHIATIAVGLLLAIGLEQGVEYIHHRRQVSETRQALRIERETNRQAYAQVVKEFRRQNAALLNNLLVLHLLQQHPGAPAEQLPGILVWHAIRVTFAESAWKTAEQSSVTALMPQDEVRRYALLYERIENANRNFDAVWPAIIRARLYGLEDPDPSHLSPAQIAQELDDTRAALVQLYTQAAALVQLVTAENDFGPGLTKEELNSDMRVTEIEQDPRFAAAIARTNSRLPADNRIPIPQSASGSK